MHKEKHIVIIDDAEGIRSFLSLILEAEGYVVHQASSAEKGLEIIHNQPIDMVTLDLGLPGMDGTEMLEIVKQDYPELPVAVISVRDDLLTKQMVRTLGADYYLAKPFEANDVLDVVNETLSS